MKLKRVGFILISSHPVLCMIIDGLQTTAGRPPW